MIPGKISSHVSRLLFAFTFLALCSLRAGAIEETFASRPTGFAGKIGDGVALFLPADLPLDRMPTSLCLLERPHPAGALPAGWTLAPQFSFSAGRTRATLAVSDGTSLYGTG